MKNIENPSNRPEEGPVEIVAAENVSGVVINEILADPTITGSGDIDTDGNGISNNGDEFVELFNSTGASVDISGWTLDFGAGVIFTFPAGATIPAGGYVTVVANWDTAANPLPANTYSVGNGGGILTNGGDVIMLSDGTTTATASYGSGGGGDDFGSSDDAVSMAREPDGGMTINDEAVPTPNAANICFYRGTGIQTPIGYKNIESLKVNDTVTTASGKVMSIKWVGIQSVEINSKRNLLQSNPILIQKDALEEGVPSADLRVSPNHAIYVDGLLINAGALVNGVNIIQESPIEDFKYYHIELDSHELIIAENTSAESYLPQKENRDDFDNAAEFDLQYPNGRKLILWPLDYPRISSQAKVPEYIKDKILKKEGIRKIA